MADVYDVAIIGCGAAGMTAAIYAVRYKMNTIIVGKEPGGTITGAHLVENWPGIPSITGMELMLQFKRHVEKFDVPIKEEEVLGVSKDGENFKITADGNNVVLAKTVILALGTKRRQLNVPGEKEFLGKGVSYCATCDAPFYRGKKVAVVGGANAACMAAVLISEYASQVYQIYRQESLRGEPTWVERVLDNPKIEVIYNANVTAIMGEKFVKKIKLDNGKELDVDGIFIEIGAVPNIALIKSLGITVDKGEQIIVDEHKQTNIEGIYAAGDVTNGVLKQVVTAAGDGAIAALSAYNQVQKMKKK